LPCSRWYSVAGLLSLQQVVLRTPALAARTHIDRAQARLVRLTCAWAARSDERVTTRSGGSDRSMQLLVMSSSTCRSRLRFAKAPPAAGAVPARPEESSAERFDFRHACRDLQSGGNVLQQRRHGVPYGAQGRRRGLLGKHEKSCRVCVQVHEDESEPRWSSIRSSG
jgi:hypothetical protein